MSGFKYIQKVNLSPGDELSSAFAKGGWVFWLNVRLQHYCVLHKSGDWVCTKLMSWLGTSVLTYKIFIFLLIIKTGTEVMAAIWQEPYGIPCVRVHGRWQLLFSLCFQWRTWWGHRAGPFPCMWSDPSSPLHRHWSQAELSDLGRTRTSEMS